MSSYLQHKHSLKIEIQHSILETHVALGKMYDTSANLKHLIQNTRYCISWELMPSLGHVEHWEVALQLTY